MIAVTQVVDQASVKIIGHSETEREIKNGLIIFLGVSTEDTQKDVDLLVSKITKLRVFRDETDKMNLDIKTIQGEILVISQFTLLGNLKGGNRPDFTAAADKDLADTLYQSFTAKLTQEGLLVKTGYFGEHMIISSQQNGPVTIILNSKEL